MNNYKLLINNYQLPEVYKQTEVGVIPEDWDVTELARLITAGPKNGYSGQARGDAKGTPTLRLTATSSGHLIINSETVKHLNETINPRSELFLQPGDVLIQRSNTYELVGTTAVFDGPANIYVYPDLMMRLRFSDRLTAHWFWKYANSAEGRRFFLSAAAGSTGSMPKISGAKLRQMPIPMPSAEERHAIAATLSDVDALIASLDKLITKQRHLKTATMQQLLTGKKRLPGFGEGQGYKQTEVGLIPEDWKYLKIPEVVITANNSIKIGPFGSSLKREYLTKSGYKVYGQENIYEKDMSIGDRFIGEERFRKLKSCETCPGDFLISMMGTVGKCLIVPEEVKTGIMDSHLLRLRLDRARIDPALLICLFESKIIFNQIKQLSVGGIMEGLSSKIIKGICLPLAPVKEQRAIATVLSDMDAAISALETRRAKTQAIKQGMMQELLTGRTRLV